MSEVETAATATPSESAPVPSGSPTEPTPTQSTGAPPAAKDSNGYDVPPSATPGSSDPLGEALAATYDRITAENVTAEADAQPEPPPPSAEPVEPPSEATVDETPPQEVATAPVEQAPEQVEQGHEQPAIEAPNSWSAEAKSEWNGLSPKAQEYIAQREAEAHQKISQQGEIVQAFQPVIDAIAASPYANANPSEMLTGLIRAQQVMDTNPAEGIKWLAQNYGVDLNTLVGRPVEADDSGIDDLFHDPRVDTLQKEISDLKQVNQQLLQQQQVFWQEQQQRAIDERSQNIQKAISAAKEAHPHFDALRDDIAREIKALQVVSPDLSPQQLLDEAYKRAYALSPDVQKKARAEAEAKAKEEAAAKLAKAKAQQTANVRSADKVTRHNDRPWDDADVMRNMFDSITSR